MAARIRKNHQDEIRAKIQASQLINVLQDHALSDGGEISPTRMKAIEILLRKSVPDLASVELTGEGGGPLEHDHTHGLSAETFRFLESMRPGSSSTGSATPVQD